MVDYAEELLAPRAVAETGLFDPQRVDKLLEKVKGGQVLGMKANMVFVGVLSTLLLANSFIQNFPKEKGA